MKRQQSWILLGITLFTLAFIVFPMVLSVMAGFMNNYGKGVSEGFTLKWIIQVWNAYGHTLLSSIFLGVVCVFITALIGVPCAYAFARIKHPLMSVFKELITLPVAIPGLATALALLLAYGHIQFFRQSYLFILCGHVIFTLPFMINTVTAAFKKPELRQLEEAAKSLRANFYQRFLGILVPAVLPSIVAGCLMVFTLSIGEFNLTWMLHTPLTRTLPVGLADSYASMRVEVGSAYTTLFFVVILPFLYGLQVLVSYFQRSYGKV